MRKIMIVLSFFMHQLTFGQGTIQRHSNIQKDLQIEIKPQLGIDMSRMSFNFAGNEQGTNPNILSELIWSNTISPTYGTDINVQYKKMYISASALLSYNISGDVSDSDYDRDNRQGMYKKTLHSNHKGNGVILNFKPGYVIYSDANHTFIGFAAYEFNQRKNYILNYTHLNSSDSRYLKGLNNTYEYSLHNIGLGATYLYTSSSILYSRLNFETYYSNYDADARWNLRTEFQQPLSFEHKGPGWRFRPQVELGFRLSHALKLGVNYALDYYIMQNGKDYLYTKNEGTLVHKLNKVDMLHNRITLGLSINL